MPPYKLMYRFGIAPWEWRDIAGTWKPILEGQNALKPGRALDVGCGTGRDAVYLTKHGWRVTGLDFAGDALAKAKQRAADQEVQVEPIQGDVGRLDQLGLEPGYTLLYDFGCIQGLPDAARQGAANGLTRLAAPGASLFMFAFKAVGTYFSLAGSINGMSSDFSVAGGTSRTRSLSGTSNARVRGPRRADGIPPDSPWRRRIAHVGLKSGSAIFQDVARDDAIPVGPRGCLSVRAEHPPKPETRTSVERQTHLLLARPGPPGNRCGSGSA